MPELPACTLLASNAHTMPAAPEEVLQMPRGKHHYRGSCLPLLRTPTATASLQGSRRASILIGLWNDHEDLAYFCHPPDLQHAVIPCPLPTPSPTAMPSTLLMFAPISFHPCPRAHTSSPLLRCPLPADATPRYPTSLRCSAMDLAARALLPLLLGPPAPGIAIALPASHLRHLSARLRRCYDHYPALLKLATTCH